MNIVANELIERRGDTTTSHMYSTKVIELRGDTTTSNKRKLTDSVISVHTG